MGGRKNETPPRLKPMLAVLGDAPFDDPDWIFEMKLDGYRALAAISGDGEVDLYSRNLIPFDQLYPNLLPDLAKIPHSALLDGEVVIEDDHGISRFQLLQNYKRTRKGIPKYYVFDLLYLNGESTVKLSLFQRKELLEELLKDIPFEHVFYSKHVVGKGKAFFKAAEKMNLEGIIAKKGTSPYRVNFRTSEWLKIKISQEQEAIIAGISAPRGSRKHFGALLLAVYDKGKLKFIGKCGTGFTGATLKELYHQLKPHFIDHSPFEERIVNPEPVQWIEPEVVCQVRFTEWTDEMRMRHPVYLGLRMDKKAEEVVAETPIVKTWNQKQRKKTSISK